MATVAFIFARGGSKGLIDKNIRIFFGKPLIAWAIEQAKTISKIDRVIVSTDSLKIAKVARAYGAEVPFLRPSEYSQDESPEVLAWKHALNFLEESSDGLPDIMLSLPTTAPLRNNKDIENCISIFEKEKCDVVLCITDSHRNPYFNMIELDSDGFANVLISSGKQVSRRQDSPTVYDLTTVCYVVNPKFLLSHNSIFEGKVKTVLVPQERAIDIDSALDFEIAEYIFSKRSSLNDRNT